MRQRLSSERELDHPTGAASRSTSSSRSLAKKSPHALQGALSKHGALLHVVVHERQGFASFANVALASLDLFARAITSAKLPPVAKTKPANGKKKRGK